MMELKDFYKGKKVLVTGHTGFKGSWLCEILLYMGADVVGYALEPSTKPALFDMLNLSKKITSYIGDIRDLAFFQEVFEKEKPEIIFHLAAQPIVLESYKNPVYTYETNVMGTVNLLECVRLSDTVKSVVNVTTDKVYQNNEWCYGYRENDRLNGFDPYSNSKSCSELVTSSYIKSFLADAKIPVSTCRAGNVIGGGDFSPNRIVPDCVRAMEDGKEIVLRNPNSTRPYQHVLEPLSGYMLLASKMWNEPTEYCEGWNFGPRVENIISVWEVGTKILENYGKGELKDLSDSNALHEAELLMLDISKAKFRLGWEPRMDIEQCIQLVIDWYRCYKTEEVYGLCLEEIKKFIG